LAGTAQQNPDRTVLVYWAVLTFATLLLDASVSPAVYLFTVAQASGV
jgi:hypothetical protein